MLKAKSKVALLSICAVIVLAACNKSADKGGAASSGTAGQMKFETETEKVSYILGYGMGKTYSQQSVEIDSNIFLKGLSAGLSKDENVKAAFSEDEMREIMRTFRLSHQEKRRKEREEAKVKNLAAGEKFLAENKGKPGVVTLTSGLQYKVVAEGKGEKPSEDDTVKIEYKGTLLDGTVFDSTETRGKPATFLVKGVVPGMSEALKLMPTGSKWELYIPSSLAYGENGAGAKIGPNETLKFEVQLISIEKGKKTDAKKVSDTKKKPAKKKV